MTADLPGPTAPSWLLNRTPGGVDEQGVRWLIGLALAVGCVAYLLAVRYRPRGQWMLTPAILAVIFALFTMNEMRWARFEGRLAYAASPILGERDSGFTCERVMRNFFSSHARPGHVEFDANGAPAQDAFLSMKTCARIKSWLRDPGAADQDESHAVHIVAHEAAHLVGVTVEAQAECLAIQAGEEVRTRLGADPQQARSQAAEYYHSYYPRLPGEYRSADCAPGGALDNSPEDGVWP